MSDDWRKHAVAEPSNWRASAIPDPTGLPSEAERSMLTHQPQAASPYIHQRPAWQSALQGAQSGLTLDFADELAGLAQGAAAGGGRAALMAMKTGPGRVAVRALYPNLKQLPDEAVDALLEQAALNTAEAGGMSSLPDSPREAGRAGYVQGRNDYRDEAAKAKAANPGVYGAAEIGGSMLAAPTQVPGLKGLSPIKRLAVMGAMQGGVAGAGHSSADLVDPQAADAGGVGRLLGDVGMGAAFGGATGATLGAVGQGAQTWFRRRADENFAKAGGLVPGMSDQALEAGLRTPDDIRRYGHDVGNTGFATFGSTPEEVLKRANAKAPLFAEIKENVLSDADAAALKRLAGLGQAPGQPKGGFDFGSVALKAGADLTDPLTTTATARRQAAQAIEMVKDIAREGSEGPGTYKAADKLKSDLQRLADYTTESDAVVNAQKKQVAAAMRQALEDQVAAELDPVAAMDLKGANQSLQTIMRMRDLAGNQARRDMAKNPWRGILRQGLIPALGGVAGGAVGHAAGGAPSSALGAAAGAALANAIAPRIPSAMAVTQRAVAPLAPKLADAATRLEAPRAPEDAARVFEWLQSLMPEADRAKAVVKALRGEGQR